MKEDAKAEEEDAKKLRGFHHKAGERVSAQTLGKTTVDGTSPRFGQDDLKHSRRRDASPARKSSPRKNGELPFA